MKFIVSLIVSIAGLTSAFADDLTYDVRIHEATGACWRIAGQTHPTSLLATVRSKDAFGYEYLLNGNEASAYLRQHFEVVTTSGEEWARSSMNTQGNCIWNPAGGGFEAVCVLAHRAGDMSKVPQWWTTAYINYDLVDTSDSSRRVSTRECMQSIYRDFDLR